MSAPSSRQLLKVLSGPQSGGELLLADGEYSLGRGDANDIVLLDDRLAEQHATLVVRDGVVECRGLGGARLVVDGVATDGARLAPYQCVTLGGIHLAIGPADGAWPRIALPAEAPAGEAQADTAAASSDGESVASAAAGEQQPAVSSATVGGTEKPAEPAKAHVVAASPVSRRRRWPVAAALAALAVVLLTGFALMVSNSGAAVPPPDRAAQHAALEAALAKVPGAGDVKVADQHNRFVVTGYVANAAAKRAVRSAAFAADPRIRFRVYDAEGLVTSVADTLRMYDMDYACAAGEPGEVVVRGVLRDQGRWAKVRAQIASDLPQVAKLTEDFSNVPKPVHVPAVVAAEPGAAPAAADKPLAQSVPEVSSVVPPPVPTAPTPVVGLPAIQSISVGRQRTITLLNGVHIFPGAVLDSGYTVTSIGPDGVVLTRGGSRQVIKFGS